MEPSIRSRRAASPGSAFPSATARHEIAPARRLGTGRRIAAPLLAAVLVVLTAACGQGPGEAEVRTLLTDHIDAETPTVESGTVVRLSWDEIEESVDRDLLSERPWSDRIYILTLKAGDYFYRPEQTGGQWMRGTGVCEEADAVMCKSVSCLGIGVKAVPELVEVTGVYGEGEGEDAGRRVTFTWKPGRLPELLREVRESAADCGRIRVMDTEPRSGRAILQKRYGEWRVERVQFRGVEE